MNERCERYVELWCRLNDCYRFNNLAGVEAVGELLLSAWQEMSSPEREWVHLRCRDLHSATAQAALKDIAARRYSGPMFLT